jgi:hypothetical protein
VTASDEIEAVNDPRALHADHPVFHDRGWAIADALTAESVYGKPPAYQVGPILEHLAKFGWKLERIGPAVGYAGLPTRSDQEIAGDDNEGEQ